jgi:hypothetical protein
MLDTARAILVSKVLAPKSHANVRKSNLAS